MNNQIKDLLDHLEKVSRNFPTKPGKVVAHIAGGTAVTFHARSRISDDADIAWSHKVLLPQHEQTFLSRDPDGNPVMISVDAGFSESIGLFHPDWKQDATILADLPRLVVKIISPVDLIVSKIGRFISRDRDDICAIAAAMPIDPEVVRKRTEEALEYYIGDTQYVRTSLGLALDIIRDCSRDPSSGPSP